MAKKILILSTKIDNVLFTNIQKYSVNKIYRSSYKSLNFTIEQGKVEIYDRANELYLNDYDLVYFKQYSIETSACVAFLQDQNIPFLNRDLGSNFIFNKLAQYVKLAHAGYLVPKSIYSSHKGLKELAKDIQYPIILKSIASSLGKDNFLVKSYAELVNILESNTEIPFIIQEFIPNNFDYRVLILGGKLGTVLKRTRQNSSDHRNNTALGAHEDEISTPDEVLVQLSIEVANTLGKDIAGVDLIFDEVSKRHYVIEVNSKPSFTYDASISSEVPQFTKYIDSMIG